MPVILAGNDAQKRKYLGRLIEEPLMCVSKMNFKIFLSQVEQQNALVYNVPDSGNMNIFMNLINV